MGCLRAFLILAAMICVALLVVMFVHENPQQPLRHVTGWLRLLLLLSPLMLIGMALWGIG